jgi:ABC-type branched-subunit amino acid transport system substrate-binding protein
VSRLRNAAFVAAVSTVVVAAASALPAAAGARPGAARAAAGKATEIGVSGSAIRIAVVADVDNPFAPGLFQGAVDGVQGAAKLINKTGGVAGRKLQVDFIDSHLNPNDSRNAIIKACSQDLALVGTAALFLATAQDEIDCHDQAGQAVGLPDFGAVVTGVQESCSPVAFPVNPPQLLCDTKDQHPQTFQGNQGDAKYFLRTNGPDLHGAFLVSNDTKDAQNGGLVLTGVSQAAGIKADQNVTRSGRDQQSAYTAIVNKMKQDGSNFSYMTLAVNSALQLRQEAALQGLTDPKIIWECTTACYDKALSAAGSAADGEYVPLAFLPFEEARSNKTLQNFLKYVGSDKANGFAVYGFTATLLFKQAVENAIAKGGNNALTRSSLLAGVKAVTSFNAGGMIGTENPAGKVASTCFMLVQYKGGAFKRVYPKKAGSFDCKASNRTTIKADLLG